MSRWAQMYQIGREAHTRVEERLAEQYAELEEADALDTLDIDGGTFSYAVIPREAIAPDRVLRQKWVNTYAFGFTVPDSDDRVSFVLEEVPEPYRDIVAAHEYVENREQDHDAAMELEMAVAAERGRLDGYLGWMEEHYPGCVGVRRGLL